MVTSKLLLTIPHGFGTKDDGDGRDRKTLEAIGKAHLLPKCSIIIPKQSHSSNVEIVDDQLLAQVSNTSSEVSFLEIADTDGLVTKIPQVMLTVVTADCVPILYYDPAEKIVGISHGGWKGTLEKIPVQVVEAMQSLGSVIENIHVSIGPSIGPCCYEIYGERLDQFREVFGSDVIVTRDGNTYLDLHEANKETLLSAVVLRENIDSNSSCTSCDIDKFFSYKRDHGIEGEMLSFIMLP